MAFSSRELSNAFMSIQEKPSFDEKTRFHTILPLAEALRSRLSLNPS